MTCTVQAFAKLNLMLDILGKLPKDYHEVFMLMQSVSLADTVRLETNRSGELTVRCSQPDIPTGDGNIAYRAAQAFFKAAALPNEGLDIFIEKRIPHAAGLAGGSADAAAVLAGLNRMFAFPLSARALADVGKTLGADVPFCLTGGLMLAQYDGTVLSPLPALELGKAVLVKPDVSVSTPEAYRAFDEAERIRHLDRRGMLHAVMQQAPEDVFRRVGNVFEQFIDVPDRVVIKAVLRDCGARCACMSGSGPTVFGLFDDSEKAEAAASKLKERFSSVFLCTPTENGIVFT